MLLMLFKSTTCDFLSCIVTASAMELTVAIVTTDGAFVLHVVVPAAVL